MNNLRFSASALPSLRKHSACCLGRWLEIMFIAVMLATEGGRGVWGRGGRGAGSHISLPAVTFSLEGHAAIPLGTVPVAEGALALSKPPGRGWSFNNSSVWLGLGFEIHSAGHESLSITISKTLFLIAAAPKQCELPLKHGPWKEAVDLSCH